MATLVEAVPLTGRTHQIRVHATHSGWPIAGDEKYGDEAFNRLMREHGLRRLFLHAASLTVDTPAGQHIEVQAPLEPSLQKVLDTLGSLCNLMSRRMSLMVFDWDGTLMDSEARIVACLRQSALDVGMACLPDAALRNVIGLGLKEAIESLYPDADSVSSTPLSIAIAIIFWPPTASLGIFSGGTGISA